MKSRIFVLVIVLTLAMLFASPALAKKPGQTKTGSVLLGGGLDLSVYAGGQTIDPDGGDEVDIDQMAIGMEALSGYFVIRNLEVGGFLEVEYEKEGDDDGETKTTTWGIGPQVGYFYPFSSKVMAFGMLPIGYMKFTTEYDPDAQGADKTETTWSGFFAEPRGGIVYNLNSKLGLFAALYLRYFSGSGNQDSGNSDVDFDVKATQYGLKVGLFGFL